MTSARRVGWLLTLWLPSCMAWATHVTDKLAVGLYPSVGAEQPMRLLTSGTPLERLGSSGEHCKVRLGGGEEGWLECRYLTDEKPARAMLLEAQAGSAQLRRELDDARAQLRAQRQETAQLGLRLQAAERLLGSEVPEQRRGASPQQSEPEKVVPETDNGARWGGLLLSLIGMLGGLLLGGALFFWRCRRRYGGLRI